MRFRDYFAGAVVSLALLTGCAGSRCVVLAPQDSTQRFNTEQKGSVIITRPDLDQVNAELKLKSRKDLPEIRPDYATSPLRLDSRLKQREIVDAYKK